MTGSSGARETNGAASKPACSAAAAASLELAAPREIPISETLALFHQHWLEQQRLDVSARAKLGPKGVSRTGKIKVMHFFFSLARPSTRPLRRASALWGGS